MQVFEFVIAIVALGLLYKLIDAWVRRRGVLAAQVDAQDRDLLRRLDELEERVRVLERIVTDDRYDLKRRFEDLGA